MPVVPGCRVPLVSPNQIVTCWPQDWGSFLPSPASHFIRIQRIKNNPTLFHWRLRKEIKHTTYKTYLLDFLASLSTRQSQQKLCCRNKTRGIPGLKRLRFLPSDNGRQIRPHSHCLSLCLYGELPEVFTGSGLSSRSDMSLSGR